MNSFGLVAGLVSLVLIGLGFPLVIQTERLFGYLAWPYLLGLGAVLIALSAALHNDWASLVVGVVGAACAWGSTELKEQAARVTLGWFPSRPNKIRVPFAGVIKTWKAPRL